MQLGFASQSKLLFRCYQQTYELRSQAHLALARMHGWLDDSEDAQVDNRGLDLLFLKAQEDLKAKEYGLTNVLNEANAGTQLARCCHFMHTACLQKYVAGEKSFSDKIVGIDDKEIRCPVCKRLSNCFVPLLPPSFKKTEQLINEESKENKVD